MTEPIFQLRNYLFYTFSMVPQYYSSEEFVAKLEVSHFSSRLLYEVLNKVQLTI